MDAHLLHHLARLLLTEAGGDEDLREELLVVDQGNRQLLHLTGVLEHQDRLEQGEAGLEVQLQLAWLSAGFTNTTSLLLILLSFCFVFPDTFHNLRTSHPLPHCCHSEEHLSPHAGWACPSC